MSQRDIGQELLESVRAIKRGEGPRIKVAEPDVRAVREKVGVSQTAFAALLGVSPRTFERPPHLGLPPRHRHDPWDELAAR
jgi:putative transcriptional regulator